MLAISVRRHVQSSFHNLNACENMQATQPSPVQAESTSAPQKSHSAIPVLNIILHLCFCLCIPKISPHFCSTVLDPKSVLPEFSLSFSFRRSINSPHPLPHFPQQDTNFVMKVPAGGGWISRPPQEQHVIFPSITFASAVEHRHSVREMRN
jgi:hypothetical protein